MHLAPWFWFVALALVCAGVAGLLQKLSTNHMSAESALIWLVVGFSVLIPWLYFGNPMAKYSTPSLTWVFVGGILNAVGSWALLAALESGGKAAIVIPLTSLYPLIVAICAPFVLHESTTKAQGAGIVCAVGAVILLSM
jgi:uncharacterized membrane protein